MTDEQRVDHVLGRMTLDEKVGQCLTQSWRGSLITPSVVETITKLHAGGLRIEPYTTEATTGMAYGKASTRSPGAGRAATSAVPETHFRVKHPGVVITATEYARRLNELKRIAMDRPRRRAAARGPRLRGRLLARLPVRRHQHVPREHGHPRRRRPAHGLPRRPRRRSPACRHRRQHDALAGQRRERQPGQPGDQHPLVLGRRGGGGPLLRPAYEGAGGGRHHRDGQALPRPRRLGGGRSRPVARHRGRPRSASTPSSWRRTAP